MEAMRYLNRFLLRSRTQHRAHFHSKSRSQSLNTLLKGYVKSNSTTKALLLFRSIQNKRASSVDSFTIHFVLKACSIRSSQVEGKQIHGISIRLGLESVIFIQTNLINMYSASGSLEDAFQVFDEISIRNVICWTAMISACVDNGKPDRALKLFREMQMENFDPDQVTVTVALSACADLGTLDMGEWIHSYVRRKQGFEADLCLNNALINMYVKCGDIDAARRTFDKLSAKDVTTWTSMIVGHALHGEAEKALKLFTEMENQNEVAMKNKVHDGRIGVVQPNEVTFIGVLMACGHAGMVPEGWRYFKSMSKKYGLKPRISHYGCMVDLLCRAGVLHEAYSFINGMPIQPNAVVWRTLLGACSLHGLTELGTNVRRKLIEIDPAYVGDDVTMSNTYASAGMWNEKLAVRDQMKHRRPPGCSLIALGNGIHQFTAADTSHPLRREIYDVLQTMAKTDEGLLLQE